MAANNVNKKCPDYKTSDVGDILKTYFPAAKGQSLTGQALRTAGSACSLVQGRIATKTFRKLAVGIPRRCACNGIKTNPEPCVPEAEKVEVPKAVERVGWRAVNLDGYTTMRFERRPLNRKCHRVEPEFVERPATSKPGLVRRAHRMWIRRFYKGHCCPREIFSTLEAKLRDKIESWGLRFEVHEVHFKSSHPDHRLVVHHLWDPVECDLDKPVFIQHGMLNSSADFLLDETSLGSRLAKKGYDVWLGNFRGNCFSGQHHETMGPDSIFDEKYWDFSWHEHGLEDLPTMINFVLDRTCHRRIDYIGHSMGTTSLFVMCASLPEMNDKIRSAQLLAPVFTLDQITGPAQLFTTFLYGAIRTLEIFGIHTPLIPRLLRGCFIMSTQAELFLFASGFHHFKSEKIDPIMDFGPSGCSTKTLKHFLQNNTTGTFKPYGATSSRGAPYYWDPTDPNSSNPLKKVTCAVVLRYADGDWTGCRNNIKKIAEGLANCQGVRRVDHHSETFSHLDFTYGCTGDLYEDIIEFIEDYDPDWQHPTIQKELENGLAELNEKGPGTTALTLLSACNALGWESEVVLEAVREKNDYKLLKLLPFIVETSEIEDESD